MSSHIDKHVSLACAVLTVSDTRTAGDDTSGNLLAKSLADDGHICARREIVRDNLYDIRRVISDWIADPKIEVILTSGGTGFAKKNCLPEAITPLFDQQIDGFGELFRQLSYADIGGAAIQSRALAGVANDTVIFCMPGSNNACQLAWTQLIRDQLDSTYKPCNFATHLHNIRAQNA
jgi:molybdenum cofactor biosynthesis protein B